MQRRREVFRLTSNIIADTSIGISWSDKTRGHSEQSLEALQCPYEPTGYSQILIWSAMNIATQTLILQSRMKALRRGTGIVRCFLSSCVDSFHIRLDRFRIDKTRITPLRSDKKRNWFRWRSSTRTRPKRTWQTMPKRILFNGFEITKCVLVVLVQLEASSSSSSEGWTKHFRLFVYFRQQTEICREV